MQKNQLRLVPYYLAIQATNGIYNCFITLYFSERGYDNAQIGLLMSITPLAAMLAQPIIGYFGDRVRYKNSMLMVLLALCTGLLITMGLPGSIWYIGAVLGMFSMLFAAVPPMGDTIALESLDGKGFGPVRMMGSFAYATVSMIGGTLMAGKMHLTPYVTAIAAAATICGVLCMPRVTGKRKKRDKGSFRVLFANKRLITMMVFGAMITIGISFYTSFYSIHFTKTLGGSESLLGVAYFVASVSQVPFLLTGDKLYEKYGIGKLLVLSGALLLLRWCILGLSHSLWVAFVTQVLHSYTFLLVAFCMAKYINEAVPGSHKASAQMFYTVVLSSGVKIIANFAAGQVAQYFGTSQAFLCAAVLTAVPLALLVVYLKHSPDKNADVQDKMLSA